MSTEALPGFASGFINSTLTLYKLRADRERQVQEEERQREQIKLLQAQVKGQEASRQLEELKIRKELETMQRTARLGEQFLHAVTAPGAAPAGPDVASASPAPGVPARPPLRLPTSPGAAVTTPPATEASPALSTGPVSPPSVPVGETAEGMVQMSPVTVTAPREPTITPEMAQTAAQSPQMQQLGQEIAQVVPPHVLIAAQGEIAKSNWKGALEVIQPYLTPPLKERLELQAKQASLEATTLGNTKTREEIARLGRKAIDYGYGTDLNAAIAARYGDELRTTGGQPTSAMVAQAQQDVEAAKVRVGQASRATTSVTNILPKNISEADREVMKQLNAGGLAAQHATQTLTEIERLIGEGVYGTGPEDLLIMKGYESKLLYQNDPKAARTARVKELGSQLVLAQGSLGGQVSDADRDTYAKAAGSFQNAKNIAEMRESIKSMRTIARKAIENANSARKTWEETGRLPEFTYSEPPPAPQTLDPAKLTPEDLKKMSPEQLKLLRERMKQGSK